MNIFVFVYINVFTNSFHPAKYLLWKVNINPVNSSIVVMTKVKEGTFFNEALLRSYWSNNMSLLHACKIFVEHSIEGLSKYLILRCLAGSMPRTVL